MFHHRAGELTDSFEAVNSVNKILLTGKGETISVRYNTNLGNISVDIQKDKIYDFYIRLLSREIDNEVTEGSGNPIAVSDWLAIERAEAIKIIKQIESELNYDRISYANIDGARVNVQYYSGILILTDKQKVFLQNVVEYRSTAQICLSQTW